MTAHEMLGNLDTTLFSILIGAYLSLILKIGCRENKTRSIAEKIEAFPLQEIHMSI